MTNDSYRQDVRRRLLKENQLPPVPEDWSVVRLRYVFRESKLRNGDNPVGEMLSISGYRGVEVKVYKSEEKRRTAEELETYRVVKPGQLAVNTMWLNHRGLGVSDVLGHVSPAYSVYDILGALERKYAHYLLRSDYYLNIFKGQLYGIRPNSYQIKESDWLSIPILVPPLATQKVIADFLDRETARINQLIEKKERFSSLLIERAASEIRQAITKGIGGDTMKESGNPWLGEIPAHWDVVSLQRLLRVQSGDFITTDSFTEQGYPIYGGNGFRGYCANYNTEPETILIGRYGALCGNVHVVRERVWATEHAFRVIPLMPFDTEFLARFIEALELRNVATRSAQPGLNSRMVRENFIALPPIYEQHQIASWLSQRDDKRTLTIRTTRKSIEKLNELRSALITAAVTGQIDVEAWGKRGVTEQRLEAAEAMA